MSETHHNPAEPAGEHHHERFEIQIDRTRYTVHMKRMTGEQLRHVPTPPIGPDRDLFEVVPGGSDRKIGDHQEVEIRNGLRFFTAPAQIRPGKYRDNTCDRAGKSKARTKVDSGVASEFPQKFAASFAGGQPFRVP